MNLNRKIGINTLTQLFGRLGGVFLSAILFRAISGRLGVSGVGEYNTAFVYIQIFGAIGDLGLYLYLVRAFAKDEQSTGELLGNTLGFRLLFTLFLFVISLIIVTVVPDSTYTMGTKFGILLGSAIAGSALLFQTLTAYFQQQFRSELIVIPELLGKLVTLAVTFVAIGLGFGLNEIMLAALLGSIFTLIMAWLIIRRFLNLSFRFDTRLWRQAWIGIWPMATLAVLSLLHSRIDTVILSLLKGSRSYEMGIYGGAYRIYDLILVIPGVLAGNLIPVLTRAHGHSVHRFRQTASASAELSLTAGISAAFVLFVLAPYIILVFAGPNFIDAVLPLRILALSLMILFLSQHITNLLIASDEVKRALTPLLIVLFLNALFNLLLIPRAPILVPAILTCLTETLLLLLKWYMLPSPLRPRISYMRNIGFLLFTFLVAGFLTPRSDRWLASYLHLSFVTQLLVVAFAAAGLTGALLFLALRLHLVNASDLRLPKGEYV